MKVLITGGAGFLSSHIVDMLIKNNYEVCIIDNLTHGSKNNLNKNTKFYEVDIRDSKVKDIFMSEKPDYVIHNAAQISVPVSIDDPMNDASINILGTLNILEAAKDCGVKKIIYPASAAIFGEPEYLPIDEAHPLEMLSPYGVSKHTVEHYLKIYKQLYNIDYVALRCSNIYGPRQDSSGEGGVIAIFCEKLLNDEKPYIYGDGEQIRDFVYVKDVAEAYIKALELNISGIYNVATNTKVTVNELFKIINTELNKNIECIYAPERKGDIRSSYMAYDKIKKVMGWEPKTTINEGIRETLEYYRTK